MTQRVKLNEVSYEGIQPGEKVVFLSNSANTLFFGFYRGLYKFIPVVEYFFAERNYHWDKKNKKYYQDDFFSIISKRVFLQRRRLWSTKTISTRINLSPSFDDLTKRFILKKGDSK